MVIKVREAAICSSRDPNPVPQPGCAQQLVDDKAAARELIACVFVQVDGLAHIIHLQRSVMLWSWRDQAPIISCLSCHRPIKRTARGPST